MQREQVNPAPETHPRQLVGQFVSFDLHRTNGTTTREKGEIVAQRWLGRTRRGDIPEYELTVRGSKSGKTVLARLTEDHVVPLS